MAKAKKSKTPPPKSTKAAESKEEKKESAKKSTHKKVEPELHEKSEKSDSTTKKPANKFYAAYMRREGPKNPGSKPIPIGKKDCFAGLKFLITGVLDSLERDECKSIVEKYGGHVVSGVSKKLDYMIVGEDAGQSKLEKATELNIKQINEDEFLQLICAKSGIKEPKYEQEPDISMDADDEPPAKITKTEKANTSQESKIKKEKVEEKVPETSKKETTSKVKYKSININVNE